MLFYQSVNLCEEGVVFPFRIRAVDVQEHEGAEVFVGSNFDYGEVGCQVWGCLELCAVIDEVWGYQYCSTSFPLLIGLQSQGT